MGAIVDYLIAGVVSTLLAIHREIPEMIPAQGAYYKNYGGLDTSLFLDEVAGARCRRGHGSIHGRTSARLRSALNTRATMAP